MYHDIMVKVGAAARSRQIFYLCYRFVICCRRVPSESLPFIEKYINVIWIYMNGTYKLESKRPTVPRLRPACRLCLEQMHKITSSILNRYLFFKILFSVECSAGYDTIFYIFLLLYKREMDSCQTVFIFLVDVS